MSDATMKPARSMKNEGTIDRAVRVTLGVALLSLMFVGPKTMWGAIGLIPLLTGLVGFCPLYRMARLSTCKECAAE